MRIPRRVSLNTNPEVSMLPTSRPSATTGLKPRKKAAKVEPSRLSGLEIQMLRTGTVQTIRNNSFRNIFFIFYYENYNYPTSSTIILTVKVKIKRALN